MSGSLEVTLATLSRITAEPGQRFVLHVKRPVSADLAASIRETWKRFMPDHRLLILDGDMELIAVDERPAEPSA